MQNLHNTKLHPTLEEKKFFSNFDENSRFKITLACQIQVCIRFFKIIIISTNLDLRNAKLGSFQKNLEFSLNFDGM